MTAMQKVAMAVFFVVTFACGVFAVATAPSAAPEPRVCRVRPKAVSAERVPPAVSQWASGRPVVGSGAVWTPRDNLLDEHRLIGGVARMKTGWYLRPAVGEDVTLTGKRLDGPGDVQIGSGPAFSEGTWWVASTFSFSDAGCWQLTARYRGTTLRVQLRVP